MENRCLTLARQDSLHTVDDVDGVFVAGLNRAAACIEVACTNAIMSQSEFVRRTKTTPGGIDEHDRSGLIENGDMRGECVERRLQYVRGRCGPGGKAVRCRHGHLRERIAPIGTQA